MTDFSPVQVHQKSRKEGNGSNRTSENKQASITGPRRSHRRSGPISDFLSPDP